MAKNRTKRQHQEPQNGGPTKKTKNSAIVTPPPDASAPPKTLHDLMLTEDDLEITVDTLNTLAANPSVLKSKACKDLRTAVFGFRKACTTGFNSSDDSNLTGKISGALADEGYVEARISLAEMHIRDQVPKLGALCRWVRDLDVVSGLAEQVHVKGAKRSEKEEQVLRVLDAIARLTSPVDHTIDPDVTLDGPIIPRKAWDLRGASPRAETYASVLDRSILPKTFLALQFDITSRFRSIERTPGHERKPPNHHPAIVWASHDNTISFSSEPPKTSHHEHPIVPNLHLLKDALTPEECTRIIATAETVGFTPDEPIRAEGEESSILAHNVYWLADTAFCTGLWNRVLPFIPATVDGKQVRGLNRRFRVYRYVPHAEYRIHIDGAWPPSSMDPVSGKYIYDASPPNAKQSSLFTFLIYLNDEFEGGETTFFLPSVKEGSLNAYPVKPIQGGIAMFPHGEVKGALLHEGTGVREGKKPSAKYVIRTDVLYDVDRT